MAGSLAGCLGPLIFERWWTGNGKWSSCSNVGKEKRKRDENWEGKEKKKNWDCSKSIKKFKNN